MSKLMSSDSAGAWDKLSKRLGDDRRHRILEVAKKRSNQIRLIIQDIHHPHNISACIRSADAFGIESVDVVTLREKFSPSTVTKGVAHWMRINKWQSVAECASTVKAKGYKIAAGYPSKTGLTLETLPIDQPLALVFANEHRGADPEWEKHIDYPFTIDMQGMVESLNISVSCAIALYTLRQRMQRTQKNICLNPQENEALLNFWAEYFLHESEIDR